MIPAIDGSKDGSRTPSIPWQALASELIGTAVLLLVGLSVVVMMFGSGSPLVDAIPREDVRRAVTGFLFGSTGALIALSPVGRESGAHINPAVTLGFWLMGKLDGRVAVGYVLAQLAGAVLGVLPLLAWGSMGRSVAYGATVPGSGYSIWVALGGEVITTFALIAGMCIFLGYQKLRPFTPALFPFLYAFMVWVEAPLSGTSTNPARSLGPSIVAGEWKGWWIYWVGPLIGTVTAIVAFSFLAKRISVAKLYYFESDPHRLFFRANRP